MAWKSLALAAILLLVDGSAYAENKSQSGVDVKTIAATLSQTNTWQQIVKTDNNRNTLLCQNLGTHNMGFIILPSSNNNATPTISSTVGTAGQLILLPNGNYEPDGGFMQIGEIWFTGTASDSITCQVSTTNP